MISHNFPRKLKPKMVVPQEERGGDLPTPTKGFGHIIFFVNFNHIVIAVIFMDVLLLPLVLLSFFFFYLKRYKAVESFVS